LDPRGLNHACSFRKVLLTWDPDDHSCLNLLIRQIVEEQFLDYNQTKLKRFSKKHIIDEYASLKEFHSESKVNLYVSSNYDYVSIVLWVKFDIEDMLKVASRVSLLSQISIDLNGI
jgi:hypothetical protein